MPQNLHHQLSVHLNKWDLRQVTLFSDGSTDIALPPSVGIAKCNNILMQIL